MKTFGRLAFWGVLVGVLGVASARAGIEGPSGTACWLTEKSGTPDGTVTWRIDCDTHYTVRADIVGCCQSFPQLSRIRYGKIEAAWMEWDGQKMYDVGVSYNRCNEDGQCRLPLCGQPGPMPDCVQDTLVIRTNMVFSTRCDPNKTYTFELRVKKCLPVDLSGWQCFTSTDWRLEDTCQLPGSCVTTGDHRGDGCCDPALNKDPARGNNLNDACTALFDRPGDRRNCCRPAGMLPPGGDPTHPRDGHPPLPGAWPLPGWCDVCGGGEGGGGGCTSDADCGGGQKCCGGTCVPGPTCGPPPSGFNAVIEVYGSEGHRWDARFKQGKVRVPMSFRLWDPAAGRYVWERVGQDGPDAPPQRPCKNRAGKVLDPNLACWSRPWLVPDFDENPTGIVRTHRLRLSGPRTVYVQPECGVEFNAVLNPAKLAAAFRGPVVTFDPKLGLRVDMNNADKCPVRQNVCADGRPCGVCPNGMPPDLDGTCPGGGTPSGTACPADGSTCEAACVYTIDLTFVYERRQTPSWCYEDSGRDTACAVPGDLSSCVSQPSDPRRDVRPSGAVDDWRVSSPWCWEQTKPKPNRDIGQPASFKDPPNCTIDADRKCIDPAYLNTKCP